jgi:hypothetical protein
LVYSICIRSLFHVKRLQCDGTGGDGGAGEDCGRDCDGEEL